VVQSELDNDRILGNNMSNCSANTINSCSESAIEEICPLHNDIIVAYNKKTQKLACNQCIYQEDPSDPNAMMDNLEGIDFTSYVASELKDLFDEKFTLYKNQLNKMNEIAPKTISKMLENTVNKFFGTVEGQIRKIEN